MLARFAIVALLSTTAVAKAETAFQPGRGISMDQWVTWPDVSAWNEPVVFAHFPEWMHFVSDRELDMLARSGIDTIRVPLDPAFILHGGDERRQRVLIERATDAVRRLVRKDFKVIADLHTIPRDPQTGTFGTVEILADPALFERYTGLVTALSAALSAFDPQKVALEVINEPMLDCGDAGEARQWQDQLGALHRAARDANPAITLLLTGACWGSAAGLAAIDPRSAADANTIWVFHSYEPFYITHQGANWAGDVARHVTGFSWPPENRSPQEVDAAVATSRESIMRDAPPEVRDRVLSDFADAEPALRDPVALRRQMAEPFETAARWADNHDIARNRILLGEFGLIRQEYGKEGTVSAASREAFYADMIRLAEDHGFAWSMWSFGGAFGLVQGFGGDPLAETPLTGLIPGDG